MSTRSRRAPESSSFHYLKSIDVSNDSSFEDKWVEIVTKIEKYSFEHFGGTHIKSLIMWHQCFFAGPKKYMSRTCNKWVECEGRRINTQLMSRPVLMTSMDSVKCVHPISRREGLHSLPAPDLWRMDKRCHQANG
jgi:hypothetical protein